MTVRRAFGSCRLQRHVSGDERQILRAAGRAEGCPVDAASGGRDPSDTSRSDRHTDALLQTKWEGLYRDDTLFHVATPAFYQIQGKWYLYAQACPLPANGNYIDGHWDLWCIACDRLIPTLPGCESIYIPGQTMAAEGAR